jgi:SAM-dependent methyltransferase
MSDRPTLRSLMAADGLADAGCDEHPWADFVEHVAETLDIGPGTHVWDAGCGAGSFLYPLSLNGYVVGGVDPSPECLALARAAMPHGRFIAGAAHDFDPAEAWAVVVASHGLAGCRDWAEVRALLARMAAKATHAIAVLNVDEEGPLVNRGRLLRLLTEVGASAVQFENTAEGRLLVFARVGSRLEPGA